MSDTDWQARAVTADEVVQRIRSGHKVFLHGAAASALPLDAALAVRARELQDVTVYQLHKEGGEALAQPDMAGHVRIQALFAGAGVREAINEGRADYVPVFLSDVPHYMREGIFPIDVAVVQVSWPDAHGYCTLGTSVDVARQAVDSASVVIAEINRQMPRTHGSGFIHLSQLDAYLLSDRPLPQHGTKSATPEAEAIGRHVTPLVEDGATLQMGIGAIPDAVLATLTGKRDLGIHTEMFSDGLVDLIQSGVVNNTRKSVYKGRILTSFVVGSQKVFDFVHDNPMVHFHPSDFINDTALIRQHERMTAINCALEVDLTGQVCADSIGTRIYSGIGGQMDFIRGAALSKGGRAIIALPSSARGGTISRIVPALTAGAGVVTTRGHVQFIVTEHGVADLRGKSLRERAAALTEIAHPDHRSELRAAMVARKLFMVGAGLPG
jgi:acyl-CoA hydrolase